MAIALIASVAELVDARAFHDSAGEAKKCLCGGIGDACAFHIRPDATCR
tara:strand:+ start:3475 stop:3621 length:147 start_codon:yes stop_codon:yes gene_type:complete